MRIIAGKYRGKRLAIPPSSITRPTSDRTREAIFNVLGHHPDHPLVEAVVLDLFAGSGAMGLEALSRGAKHVTFLENHPIVFRVLTDNIKSLQVEEDATPIIGDAIQLRRSLKGKLKDQISLVFLDPPYHKGFEDKILPELLDLRKEGYLSQQAWIVLEVSSKTIFNPGEAFDLMDERIYGAAKIYFLQLKKR